MNTKSKAPATLAPKRSGQLYEWKKSLSRNYDLYIMLIPVIAFYAIFCYAPMYGLQIAFQDYSPAFGFDGSPWVGLKHLNRYFSGIYFMRTLKNTLTLSCLSLCFSIPCPLILALLFEEVRQAKLKTTLQTISYAPNFISTVVICSMITLFLTPDTGFIDAIARMLGYDGDSLTGNPVAFKWVYVLSGVWQGVGWSSVIYSAAIAGVNQELYEAARLDGASRLKQIWHITIPSIMPTIIILTIMAVGSVMSVGYEKAFLLQNTMNLKSSEIISTYVYKQGLVNGSFSYGTMVGLFNNIVNFIILVTANTISKKLTETSLW